MSTKTIIILAASLTALIFVVCDIIPYLWRKAEKKWERKYGRM